MIILLGKQPFSWSNHLLCSHFSIHGPNNQVPPLTSHLVEVEGTQIKLNIWFSNNYSGIVKGQTIGPKSIPLYFLKLISSWYSSHSPTNFHLKQQLKSTLQRKRWYDLVRSFCSSATIILVGNKSDLREKGSLMPD